MPTERPKIAREPSGRGLPSWAVQVYSREPGELVLDPFAGSMTALVAAHRLGRWAWGVEFDAGYLAAGVARLEAELAQLTLLAAGWPVAS